MDVFESKGFWPTAKWNGRFGRWRVFNYSANQNWLPMEQGNGVANETSLQLSGPSQGHANKIVIEAEIYEKTNASVTLRNAVECLKIVDAPKTIQSAFLAKQAIAIGGWKIEYEKHRDGGYDVKCTGILDESLFEFTQSAAKKMPFVGHNMK